MLLLLKNCRSYGWTRVVVAYATVIVIALSAAGAVQAPIGRTDPKFDIARFSTAGQGMFETFHVTKTILLQEALEAGTVDDDTPLLVTDTASGKLALLTDQMSYHHIAQGVEAGKAWMVTF